MTSPGSLTALAEAQAALLAMLAPVAPREVATGEAAGLIAAELTPLAHPVPARTIALCDGYALRSEDLVGASPYAPALLLQAPARVAAGDEIPDGYDCVLDAQALDLSGPMAQAFVESWPGENVRRAGEDLAAGSVVIAPGRRIGALELLAAARAGLARIAVRQPRVRILSQPGASAELIARLAQREGARIVANEAADLVLVVGDAPRDAEWSLRGIALEPGRDAGVGRIGGIPAILVPSMPDQAFAVFLALARPALDRLSARAPRGAVALPLKEKIASRVGVAEIVLLADEQGRFVPLATGDLPLQLMTRATHVALISAASEGHAPGEPFTAEAIDA